MRKSVSEYDRMFYLLDKSTQCPEKDSTNNFSIDFSSPCFDVPKKLSFTAGGVQKGTTEKQETGNDCEVITGHSIPRKARDDREICLP